MSHDQEVSIVLDNAIIGPRVKHKFKLPFGALYSSEKLALYLFTHYFDGKTVSQTQGTKEPLDIIVIKILILRMQT